MTKITHFSSREIESIFNSYSDNSRKQLLTIREIIFDVAKRDKDIKGVFEEVRWGQPSYITNQTKSGSTIRLGVFEKDKIAVFFHCKTTLIERFRVIYGDKLEFSKNRAIIIDPKKKISCDVMDAISHCIQMSLRYNIDKQRLKKGLYVI